MTGPYLSAIEFGPRLDVGPDHGIAVIGCGGISSMHLAAYRAAGYRVVVLCDLIESRAVARRDEFFPDADVTTDINEVLTRGDVDVVDIATHVDIRPALVRKTLAAGKHVLSQKPFVRDLTEGADLIAAAAAAGRVLAVNQNGRWAPHFAFLLAAVRSGVIGAVSTADFAVYWPHDEIVKDDPIFANMHDLVLYDFGIHWFDVVAQLFADAEPLSVTAYTGSVAGQVIPVPTVASVVVQFDSGQATLLFRAGSHVAESGRYRVEGGLGMIEHAGESLGGATATVATQDGTATVDLDGTWWTRGMHGTMAEVLAAVHLGEIPSNTAATSLPGLQLCFAAIESSRTGMPVDPRTITGLRADLQSRS